MKVFGQRAGWRYPTFGARAGCCAETSGRHSFGQCLGWSLAESNRMKLETTTFSGVPSAGYTRRMSASPVV
jgi:hypothetical protein